MIYEVINENRQKLETMNRTLNPIDFEKFNDEKQMHFNSEIQLLSTQLKSERIKIK